MRPFRVVAFVVAMGLVGVGSARAGWNNVFQVCCNRCGTPAAVVANYGPCCDPCPQVCTTRMVQRSYYQPVVTYQTRFYNEPVTTYRTSYYWEPVTSVRYSYYRDPCSGCCQQVASPVTSLRLRSQCCPVTSYLQRCAIVPVTTQVQMYYYEPVASCCNPCATTPGVIDRTTPNGSGGTPGVQQYNDTMPPAGTSSRPQPQIQRIVPVQQPAAPPKVKLERIVALPPQNVEGVIVREDRTPQANVTVKLISEERQGSEQTVKANASGEFKAKLSSGRWLVYVQRADGKLDFVRKIVVRDEETKQFTLVSR